MERKAIRITHSLKSVCFALHGTHKTPGQESSRTNTCRTSDTCCTQTQCTHTELRHVGFSDSHMKEKNNEKNKNTSLRVKQTSHNLTLKYRQVMRMGKHISSPPTQMKPND